MSIVVSLCRAHSRLELSSTTSCWQQLARGAPVFLIDWLKGSPLRTGIEDFHLPAALRADTPPPLPTKLATRRFEADRRRRFWRTEANFTRSRASLSSIALDSLMWTSEFTKMRSSSRLFSSVAWFNGRAQFKAPQRAALGDHLCAGAARSATFIFI